MSKLYFAFILLLAVSAECDGELLLISGKPNALGNVRFAASTVAVLSNGTAVEREKVIDPETQGGFFWFDIDYDYRQAYLIDTAYNAVVLDLNNGKVAKRCPIARIPGVGGIYEWRLIDPILGPMFSVLFSNRNLEDSFLAGLAADPSEPCPATPTRIPAARIQGYATSGQAGVGGQAAQHVFFTNVSGQALRKKIGRDWVYLPIRGDSRLRPQERSPAAIVVRNREIEVILVSAEDRPDLHWARVRNSGGWFPLPTNNGANIRGFGSWVAWPESAYVDDEEKRIKANPKLAATRVRSHGSEEWRKEDSKYGTSTEFVLTHSSTVHPGILHIFDVKTQHHLRITSGQADSEVLLIEDGFVYYRVSDRLYTAAIDGEQLTGTRQIARSELIRDAHWAFITRDVGSDNGPVRAEGLKLPELIAEGEEIWDVHWAFWSN